jgi:hypothetical protein
MLRGGPATSPPISPERRARGAASTVKESCYSDRIGRIGESKIGVEYVSRSPDRKSMHLDGNSMINGGMSMDLVWVVRLCWPAQLRD